MFGIKSIGHFISGAARSAGRALHSAGHLVKKGTGALGKAVSKIPVVGSPLHALYDLAAGAPLGMIGDIASGANIGKAALKNLSNSAKDIRTVGPYVQMVASAVPGVGTVVSSGMAMGLALANGRPIDKAVIEAGRAALPGGPAAKAIFDATHAAIDGKSIKDVALSGIPIPDDAKQYVGRALDVTRAIAQGKRVDKTLLAQVQKEMATRVPPDVARAMQVATALATAKNLQDGIRRGVAAGSTELQKSGANIVKANPALAVLQKQATPAFATAIGLMQHSHVPESAIWQLRNGLKGADRRSFDLGLAAHVGAVTSKKVKSKDPAVLAGYYLAHGLKAAPEKMRVTQLRAVEKNPAIMRGVVAGARASKHDASWWARFKVWVGLS